MADLLKIPLLDRYAILATILDSLLSDEDMTHELSGTYGDPLREDLHINGKVTISAQQAQMLRQFYPDLGGDE
jgi:hypothetical protein